ncbi:polyketide cyclase [Paludisphaera borealis]|uniref:Polyketide cyclase n=1 Tax=Paludisphaera borealis TaxID=1387353 RepID=A0A1U7CQE2_9BACT|nr:polyketide cyclase [Paludisphaera borealis]APW61141.1 hypothetical protein BSF38_02645 [Paludisphaera borealis]
MTTYAARLISVSIDCNWREVYDFTAEPTNFPLWASGLASGVENSGDDWTAQGPEGPIRIRFSPPNEFGVLDHVVTVAPGVEIRIPLRVVANGTGSEVTLTLFQTPGMSDEAFAADAEWVQSDLHALKALMES